MQRPRRRKKNKILNGMVNDTLSDMLTRIRNAQLAKHTKVDVFNTKTNKKITEILEKAGLIKTYHVLETSRKTRKKPSRRITIYLKYLTQAQIPCISKMQRISSPGLRLYSAYKDLPKCLDGMGLIILTTSKGVMTDQEAKRKKLGGEILCSIY